MTTIRLLLAALALASTSLTAHAQAKSKDKTKDRDDTEKRVQVVRIERGDETRPVIGVSTSSSGERDTLGLLITGVTEGGPAEKAGLEEGNRIAQVNGVSLRLAAADAGESDMQGITVRRLTRELRKVKPGDDVELRVYAGGQFRTVKVKTIAAEDLPMRQVRLARSDESDRAVAGLNLGVNGSRRDTAGVLIVAIAEDGPAEKAGLVEGDRVAAINGVDLRVAKEDAGDGYLSSAKANRFRREMRKVKPGDDVELRVVSGGQPKVVRVKAARSGDVYKNIRQTFYYGNMGEGMAPLPPMPAMPPMPPMPPMPVMPRAYLGPDAMDMDMDTEINLDEVSAPLLSGKLGQQLNLLQQQLHLLRQRGALLAPPAAPRARGTIQQM